MPHCEEYYTKFSRSSFCWQLLTWNSDVIFVLTVIDTPFIMLTLINRCLVTQAHQATQPDWTLSGTGPEVFVPSSIIISEHPAEHSGNTSVEERLTNCSPLAVVQHLNASYHLVWEWFRESNLSRLWHNCWGRYWQRLCDVINRWRQCCWYHFIDDRLLDDVRPVIECRGWRSDSWTTDIKRWWWRW